MSQVRESFPRTNTVMVARILVAVMVVVAALVGGEDIRLLPIVILSSLVAALSIVYFVWHRFGRMPRLLLRLQFAVDVIFITLVAHYSGGLGSPFKLLYFLPVIVGAAKLGFLFGTAIAASGVAGYTILSVAGPSGWLYLEESGAVAEIATLIVSLVLVAALVGYLARMAMQREQELSSTRSELDTAELRLSSIIDSISSGLVLVDREGRVIRLNSTGQAILGIHDDSLEGREYRVVFADVPAFCEHIAMALEAGRPEARAEFFVRRTRGSSVPVGLSTSILRDPDGHERGVIAIFQDLTEARRLEERVRHGDRLAALGEFAAGLAHEIRNPLNAIKGSVDLLKEGMKLKGDNAKLVDLVTREADRLNSLIQDVLEFGRMESGRRENVRLDVLLEEAVAVARTHPSAESGVRLEVDAPEPVDGVVNADEIKRAVLNLTVNGLEAVEGKGSVCVSLVGKSEFRSHGLEGGSGCDVAIVVEDTGCGIPADKREEVFHPFKTDKKGGTGLGLSIVDKIVESHGGRITVASNPGKGSRFVVYLPL